MTLIEPFHHKSHKHPGNHGLALADHAPCARSDLHCQKKLDLYPVFRHVMCSQYSVVQGRVLLNTNML